MSELTYNATVHSWAVSQKWRQYGIVLKYHDIVIIIKLIVINFFPLNGTIILVFTQALKAVRRPQPWPRCEAHALFVIHKTNL